MSFRPEVGDTLFIEGVLFGVAEHPVAPEIPYGQEGRAGIVYQLRAGEEKRALKVFKARYRTPSLTSTSVQLEPFAQIRGLRVCKRTVLTANSYRDLLLAHPDLLYAIVMPWIEGPTWMEVVMTQQELTAQQSLSIARSLAEILSDMEQEGLAHCDLSGPNLLLPALSSSSIAPHESGSAVELVDVEQMFGPELKRPKEIPAGSAGYAHRTAPEGVWSAHADRFSGAVLLAEMLGWCDPRMREMAWGESYFDPSQMQVQSDRYSIALTVLRDRWGEEIASLFQQAWASEDLTDCANFGEWLLHLPGSSASPSLQGTSTVSLSPRAGAASTPPARQAGQQERQAETRTIKQREHTNTSAGDGASVTGSHRAGVWPRPTGKGRNSNVLLAAGLTALVLLGGVIGGAAVFYWLASSGANEGTGGVQVTPDKGVALSTASAPGSMPDMSCQAFPADNIWNRKITDLPVHPLSEKYIASIGANAPLHRDFGSGVFDGETLGIPYAVVPGSQPKVGITLTDYGDESDAGPYPVPTNVPIEGGVSSEDDRHALVVDRDSCTLYELYNAHPHSDGTWDASAGAKWDLKSNALRPDSWTSSDAAGLPVLPGLVRYDEVASGEIKHALRFTAKTTQKAHLWPARHDASESSDSNLPPMGLRVRLKSGVDISSYPRDVQVILQALKDYGMFLADNGSPWFITGTPDDRWDNDEIQDNLKTIHGSDFEAVDESGLVIDPDSGQSR
jgi:hypothetical protein